MVRLGKRDRLLACCLSAVAGYVDALGFLALGGFFVSFMSGNSTRLGIGLADCGHDAALAAGLIAAFVAGAAIGSGAGAAARRHRAPVVLGLVASLLALAALCVTLGTPTLAVTAMVLAMGAENAIFEEDGEVRLGLTYMTGALVKLGQKLAAIPFGGDRLAWIPHLLLWMGLVAGATLGAAVYPLVGLAGLWGAAAAVAVIAVVAAWLKPFR